VTLGRSRFYDLSIIVRVAFLLKRQKIDILNTHNAIACWYGNTAARIAGVPVVFTLRNNQRENYKLLLKKRTLYETARLLDKVAIKIADKTVAVSKRLERFYIEHEGIPAEKIMTINNAIDLEKVDPYVGDGARRDARQRMGIGNDTMVIGIVGDLVERKGHACLVEAAKSLVRTTHSEIIFLIVGDGPLRADLARRVTEYSLADHVVFTGHVTNAFPLLAAMDIFVLPSVAEGISRALMESMAIGMPSVCSAIDGNLEAVDDGETGFIFPVDDHETLADRLLVLVANEDLRKKMGEKARVRAKEQFDMKRLAREYECLYADLFRIHSRRRLL
jgi:glycosyltransferase involved in cell wall biosynthesis